MARRNRQGRKINGWLCLDKPQGMTSTQVTNTVKRLLDAAKVGHGGTLDPLATGILPVALGEATKTVSYVMDAPKAYEFTVRLGAATDTDDAEGKVIETSEVRPDDAALRAALPGFTGEIEQTPPIYAAVKVNGERAYDLARRGEAVELTARPVRIDEIELVERVDRDHARLTMRCGKGAYVRALARDLGAALGTCAHVVALRRTEVGRFTLADAVTPEVLAQVVEDDSLPQLLIPLKTVLADIPALALTGPQTHRLTSGQPVTISPALLSADAEEDAVIRAMCEDRVVALTKLVGSQLTPVRVFNW